MDRKKAETFLRKVEGWNLKNDKIQKVYKFKSFKESIEFVNRVAELAEREGHHPNIKISWNKVTLNLTTNAIHGLSKNDFILAAKIDEITVL